jgi:hypothetical protein
MSSLSVMGRVWAKRALGASAKVGHRRSTGADLGLADFPLLGHGWSMDRPWLTEPNELKWNDPATGLLCWIARVRPDTSGHLCGYVAVPAGHPLHGKAAGYGNSEHDADFDVHGGVTWNGLHDGSTKWWIGFDCAHAGDLLPTDRFNRWPTKDVYRGIEYVKAECAKLARQIADYGRDAPPAVPS